MSAQNTHKIAQLNVMDPVGADVAGKVSFIDFIETIKPNGSRVDAIDNNFLWLSVPIESADKEQTFSFRGSLGLDPNKVICLHRWKIWWMIPRLLSGFELDADGSEIGTTEESRSAAKRGRDRSRLPPETSFLLGERKGGQGYLLMIPTVGSDGMTFSLGASDGDESLRSSSVQLKGHTNRPSGARVGLSEAALLLATGEDPFLLIERAMTDIKASIRRSSPIEAERPLRGDDPVKISSMTSPLSRYERGPGPLFVDSFGWCTWDSFYTDLSIGRILGGLQSFEPIGVRPGFMILDDGWQNTNVNDRANGHQWGGRLASFSANFKFKSGYTGSSGRSESPLSENYVDHSRLPGSIGIAQESMREEFGLSQLVEKAKGEHGIRQLLVWHTLTGYWAGVETESKVAPQSPLNQYDPLLLFPHLTKDMRAMSVAEALDNEPFTTDGVGIVSSDKSADFFRDYHSRLQSMGVDGVKVDAQSILPALVDPRQYQTSCRGTRPGRKEGGSEVDGDSCEEGGWERTFRFHMALKSAVSDTFGNSLTDVMEEAYRAERINVLGEDKSGSSPIESRTDFPIIHCMCHSQSTLFSIAALYDDGANDQATTSSSIDEEVESFVSQIGTSAVPEKKTRIKKANKNALHLPVVRGSDDYWPQEPASHGPHIFANAFNSLLFVHIGLQDWDMFQTNLGKPSLMHAASRAVSGGPVYVSDRPEEHDADIIRRLAFPDGSVPRCIRNAQPPRRSLFLDAQRQAGVPLMLQNKNPAGGGVIAAFNIAGAVLENDKDMFRHLHEDEMVWPLANHSRSRSVAEGLDGGMGVHENPELQEYLSIRDWAVSISDIEGLDTAEDQLYIAFKGSDRKMSVISSVSSPSSSSSSQLPLSDVVFVDLPTVFDFEIVSFSPVRHIDESGTWLSVVGAIDMFNPGGAVLRVDCRESDGKGSTATAVLGVEVEVHLLGSGRYGMVSNRRPVGVTMSITHNELYEGVDFTVQKDGLVGDGFIELPFEFSPVSLGSSAASESDFSVDVNLEGVINLDVVELDYRVSAEVVLGDESAAGSSAKTMNNPSPGLIEITIPPIVYPSRNQNNKSQDKNAIQINMITITF